MYTTFASAVASPVISHEREIVFMVFYWMLGMLSFILTECATRMTADSGDRNDLCIWCTILIGNSRY